MSSGTTENISLPLTPVQVLARVGVADPSQIIAPAGVQRSVGQHLIFATNAAQVARILPRGRSAAESLALFHFGT